MLATPKEWKGVNPYCLVIVADGKGAVTLIDLDEPGWMSTYQSILTAPGRWVLARKTGSVPVLQLSVVDGEEPYYISRVVHPVGSVPDCPQCGHHMEWDRIEHRSYGIGKKRIDEHVDRLWVMPNGVVCGGDDVDRLGHEAVKAATTDMWRNHYASHGSGHAEGEEGKPKGDRGQGRQGRERRKAASRGRPRPPRSRVRIAPGSGNEDGGAE